MSLDIGREIRANVQLRFADEAQAKSGELQSIVYVCSYRGNWVNHGWGQLQNRMRLVGELEQVKWHLLSLDSGVARYME